MFAIDGCKLPSNASKEWSGTKADFHKKVEKMETAIARMISRHQSQDSTQEDSDVQEKDQQYIEKLRRQTAKIKRWLGDNDDRTGSSGRPIKSNITDNESAKMKTSKGVIQGYVGVASVDKKNQVIVNAEAFGQGQEHDLLAPIINSLRDNFAAIGHDKDIFQNTQLTADSGYHSEKNMELVFTENIEPISLINIFARETHDLQGLNAIRNSSGKDQERLISSLSRQTSPSLKI